MSIKGISLGAVAVLSASALLSTGVALADINPDKLGGTSTAEFAVIPNTDDDAELQLISVPNFIFSNVDSKTIYMGTDTPLTVSNTLDPIKVQDYRMNNKGWTLSVWRSAFSVRSTNSKLSSAELQIGTDAADNGTSLNGTIPEGESNPLSTTSSATHGDYSMELRSENNTLELGSTPDADLTGIDETNGTISADLTWTLLPGDSNSFAPALK